MGRIGEGISAWTARPRAGIGRLLDPTGRGAGLWRADELGDLLQHQLGATLSDIGFAGEGEGATLRAVLCGGAAGSPGAAAIKEFATGELGSAAPQLPAEMCRVILLAAEIADRPLALPRELDRGMLAELTWAVEQPWLDAELLSLFRDVLAGASNDDEAATGGLDRPPPAPLPRWPDIQGYPITELLGEGGMGTVWRATQPGTARTVALKVLRDAIAASPRARARFEREVELAARLDHENIARVYDGGIDSRGTCYLAMELVIGKTLDRYCADQSLSHRDVVELMRKVCRAVQHAHQRGVIHLDLKPSNILIDQRGEPKVLDFGLARPLADGSLQSATITIDGHVAGTIAFMSPEQAAGQSGQLDTQSDVYSLGIILYLLLTGTMPWDTEVSAFTMIRQVTQDDILPPRSAAPTLSRELEAILLKALEKDPARRYASAAQLADDLERYLVGEPISARPPSAAYLLKKWVARHRWPIGATSAVAVLLLSAWVWDYVHIRVARNQAVAAAAIAEQARGQEEAQRIEAQHQRGLADASRLAAERELADSLMAQADLAAEDNRWVAAEPIYEKSQAMLSALGRPTFSADTGLWAAYRHAPPPLNVLVGHHGPVTAVAFCPDGRTAVSGGADGTVRVWDIITGRLIETLRGHEAKVTSLSISADGSRVLSGSEDGTARLWNLGTGRELCRLPHGDYVNSVSLTRDGTRAATAFNTGRQSPGFALWEVPSGRKIAQFGSAPGRWIAFSPDGRTCLGIDAEGYDRLYDGYTGNFRRDYEQARIDWITISPDFHWLDFGSDTDTTHPLIHHIDLRTGTDRQTLTLDRPNVTHLAYSADSRLCLRARTDNSLHLIDVQSGRELSRIWAKDAWGAALSPDGTLALTAGNDGVIRLYDVSDAKNHPAERVVDVNSPVIAIAAVPDRPTVLTSTSERMELWNVDTGTLLARSVAKAGAKIAEIAVSPNGHWALSGGKEVLLWDINHLDRPPRVLGRHAVGAVAVAFSPDGKWAASHDGDQIKVWDLSSGQAIATWRAGIVLTRRIAFSDNGRSVRAITTHGSLLWWDARTGIWIPTLGYYNGYLHLEGQAVLPKGDAWPIAQAGGALLSWEPILGGNVRVIGRHLAEVRSLDYCDARQCLLSTGNDGAVCLWFDTGGSRTLLREPAQFGCGCFSSDGQRIFVTDDASLHILDLRWPERYRAMLPRVASARQALQENSNDPAAVLTLAEWYALNGKSSWARSLLEESRSPGAAASAGPAHQEMGVIE